MTAASRVILPCFAALAIGCSDATTSEEPASTASAPTSTTPPTVASVQPTAEPAVPTVGIEHDDHADHAPDHQQAETGTQPSLSERTAPQNNMIVTIADRRLGEILAIVVDDAGLVRYDLLDATRWRDALDQVVTAYGKAMLPDTRSQRLALWTNAYNANVLNLVLAARRSGTVTSVQDVSGFFDDRPIRVAGETLTLDQLENDRIRPLDDPRAHAALVCAAMSCPPLRNEPYRVATLDEQLDDQCRKWVNDETEFRVSGDVLELSKILDWYGEDFDVDPYGGVVGFVRAFAEPDSAVGRAARAKDVETGYLAYDWALNQAPIRQTPEK